MKRMEGRFARTRHAAVGALAALALVGAVAGVAAEAQTHRQKPAHASAAAGAVTKTPPGGGKSHEFRPGSDQPFLAIGRELVADGTITTADGQVLRGQIEAGTVDSGALASAGLTASQIAALEAALTAGKEALAPRPEHPSK
jgi:hypothetical protein